MRKNKTHIPQIDPCNRILILGVIQLNLSFIILFIIVYLNFIRPGMFYVIFGTGRGENTKVNPVTHFFMTTHLSWHYLILIIVHVTKQFFSKKQLKRHKLKRPSDNDA